MNPIRYFAIPLVMLTGLALLAAIEWGGAWSWAVVPPVLLLATLYIFTPQLRWWYWERYPPDLHHGIIRLLEKHLPYYSRLSPAEQREFRRRVFLFAEAQDFRPQNFDEVPDDIKVMPAIGAVILGMGREEFLYPGMETTVLYRHPFPSPTYERLHVSETHLEDGVVIFSMQHLMASVIERDRFLNLPLYEYAKVYRDRYPETDYPALDWEQFTLVTGFERELTEKFVGLDDLDLHALTATAFFSFPERFLQHFPEHYARLEQAFGQDPLRRQARQTMDMG